MRKILLVLALFWLVHAQSQNLISRSIQHNGITRTFKLYVPNSYAEQGESVPLLFNLHGLGSNADQQHFYSLFGAIADRENFIICLPNGTLNATNQQFWNAGFGNTVDDIGFVNALIDTLLDEYDIDTTQIFSTGMSNGGFMSLTLACELERIAKVASVTGTMTTLQANNCSPDRAVPVMLIHGTSDLTVPYNGAGGVLGGTLSVDSVINLWKAINETDDEAIYFPIPDISTTDGSTAERFDYRNGIDNSSVVLYKVTNGGHTWPGATFLIPPNGNTNQDFSASEEIWRFFKGEVYNSLSVKNRSFEFSVFPNPVQTNVIVEAENLQKLAVYNLMGAKIFESNSSANSFSIDFSPYPSGVYYIEVISGESRAAQKIIKN